MANAEVAILQPDKLINSVERQGATLQSLINQQYTTMQMLSGTALITLDTNSQFFSAVLENFTRLGELSGAQLNEQQLYNAAALEGASAMHLLVSTLSGDVAKMVPLLEQLGNSGSAVDDGANTFFGAVGAAGSLTDVGESLSKVSDLGTNLGQLGGKLAGAAGIFGKMAAFGPLLSSIAPLLIGGVLIAAIVGLVASNKKKKSEQEEQADKVKDDVAAKAALIGQASIIGGIGAAATISTYDVLKAKESNSDKGSAEQPKQETNNAQDPYQDPNSRYNVYQNQIIGSGIKTDALRDAVKTGNTEVAAQLSAVADGLQQLVKKPLDRNIKSDIVINTLRTSLTLSEFKDMLDEVLMREVQVSS